MTQEQNDHQNADCIREAQNRILESEDFHNVERLKQILKYVVDRHLAGEAQNIRAKSIAMDVYGYSPDEVADRESAIRVDIGRLRRRLAAYYANKGKNDPIVIALPKGSYAPEILISDSNSIASAHEAGRSDVLRSQKALDGVFPLFQGSLRNQLLGIVSIVAALTGIALAIQVGHFRPPNESVPAAETVRSAIFEASPARLEAMNLATAGRKLIFPAADPKRLQATALVFEVSRETDESYYGGFAGSAQVFALSALISPVPQKSEKALLAAESMVEASENLAPDAAWTHSARATYEWAAGNFESALKESATARILAPDDTFILEFDALISLFAGRFERVIENVEAHLQQTELTKISVFQNALGSAYFHSGNSEKCISIFEAAIAAGAPTGPITVAYLAAANQQLGNKTIAAKRANQILETWPEFRFDLLFEKLFHNPEDSRYLLKNLREAGWRISKIPS